MELSSVTSPNLNILVAYPYMKGGVLKLLTSPEYKDIPIRFLLDSGAFTCHTKGIKITVDQYCSFIENLPIKPWRYFMLDVIGDPEKTARNYELMRQRGLNPVPVFTYNSDFSYIDEYYKTSDCIALGGLVGLRNSNKLKSFIFKAMKKINGRKVHWLGFTNIDYVKKFKPYSCDSSSANAAAMFGVISVYKGLGREERIQKSDFRKPIRQDIRHTIERMGFSICELTKKENWIGRRNDDAYRNVQYCTTVHKSIDVEKNLGTKFFLSVADAGYLSMALNSYKRLRAHGII